MGWVWRSEKENRVKTKNTYWIFNHCHLIDNGKTAEELQDSGEILPYGLNIGHTMGEKW